MHNNLAAAALTRLHHKPAFFAEGYSAVLASDLRSMGAVAPETQQALWAARKAELEMGYGGAPDTREKPFATAGKLALIPVHGTLINRFSSSWGFVTGYNFIRNQISAAVADPEIEGIVLDVNSYGGMAANCMETAEFIRSASQQKPILAVVDSFAFSAAYALASAATKMVAIRSGDVGSIGVVATHVSYEKLLEKEGVEVTFIKAGAHKVDGNPYEALSDEAKASIQKGVDEGYQDFVSVVAKHRGLSEDAVRATEARCFSAEEGLSLGLIDGIVTEAGPLAEFPGGTAAGTAMEKEEPAVSTTTTTPPLDAAAIRQQERERMNGILNCEEAKGREGLAAHFANTDMSVEAAKAALAAAPKAAPPAQQQAPAASAFLTAMDQGGTPGVGAEAASGVPGVGGQQKQGRDLDRLHSILSPRNADGTPNTKRARNVPITVDGR